MDSKIISANEIPTDASFEGYLWLSDSTAPKVLLNEGLDATLLNEGRNPFVIEGFLFQKAADPKAPAATSYSIRYVDGKTIVCRHSLTQSDWEDNKEKEYYGNRMAGRILKFLDVWQADKDEQCLGMEVLRPQAKVFVGFAETDNNENSKKQ